jgi:hypothetical protein
MTENWDRFPSNIGEILGKIERKPFIFSYVKFEVWKGGACIYSDNSNGQILATVLNGQLNIEIDDNLIRKHMKNKFSFSEISTNGDRIMWSKDIFNSKGQTEKNNPDIASLFYQNNILGKVTFTIHDPNTLIEFYS